MIMGTDLGPYRGLRCRNSEEQLVLTNGGMGDLA